MKKKDTIHKFDRPQYKPPTAVIRPNSMDFMTFPTRIGNSLFYTDGTIVNNKNTTTDSSSDQTKRVVERS
jgi:hypothetical protein